MDSSYFCVPPCKPKFKLIVLSGYDIGKRITVLSAFILVTNEKVVTFLNIFEYLKNTFQFNPNNIMATLGYPK